LFNAFHEYEWIENHDEESMTDVSEDFMGMMDKILHGPI
jgi:hypothetical protein